MKTKKTNLCRGLNWLRKKAHLGFVTGESDSLEWRHVEPVDIVPVVYVLPVERVHSAGGRDDPGVGRQHDPIDTEVPVPRRYHRVEHGLVKKVEAHPLAHQDVDLLGNVHLLRLAMDHLLNQGILVNCTGNKQASYSSMLLRY